jgi:hypothetical protein
VYKYTDMKYSCVLGCDSESLGLYQHHTVFLSYLATTTMHSFLFPEDLNEPPRHSSQQIFKSTRTLEPIQTATKRLPQIPNCAVPAIPERDLLQLSPPTEAPPMRPQYDSTVTPPPPAYAPPPIPLPQGKAVILVTEVGAPDHKQVPTLRRTKSKWSQISGSRERREAKAVARAAVMGGCMPPLSPVVDDEFWRTGRYPSSPQGVAMVHVAF